MAPVDPKLSWKELNKARKEKRKKRTEEKIVKKLTKAAAKEAAHTEADEQKRNVKDKTPSTISIAIPGSILENAQSCELRTYVAGQIARAACIFKVDEIIVFDDYGDEANCRKSSVETSEGTQRTRRCCAQLGRLVQYLECPQYLRKYFFPLHKDLQYAGILNPLDTPHHLRQDNDFIFREGVVTNKPVKQGRGSLINVGLLQDVTVDKLLTPGLRVTVKLSPQKEGTKKLHGIVVPPNTPKVETGVYWGYTVRIANSLSKIFSQSPYEKSYDLTVGTSDKGTTVDDFECPKYRHLLVVFGGLQGLESALESDDVLNVDDPALLFDHYLNTLPNQGSRTIRTEEAVLITMASLRPKLNPAVAPLTFIENNECNINNVKANDVVANDFNEMSRFDS